MWSLQRLIILLLYRVRYFPITIRRYHRSSVGVILLRLCLSGFQISKFVTDRSHHNRVFGSEISISILNQISQNQIWDPGILNFEIGDDGGQLWLDLIHQRRLIIYLTVMGYYLPGRKQLTISREFDALFMPMRTWKDVTIRFNTHYVKASTQDIGRGYGSYLWVIANVVSLTVTGTHLFRKRITIYGEVGALIFSALMLMDDTIRMRTRRSNHQHVWVYGTITKNYISFFMRVPKSMVLRCNGWIVDFVFRKRKRWNSSIKNRCFPS